MLPVDALVLATRVMLNRGYDKNVRSARRATGWPITSPPCSSTRRTAASSSPVSIASRSAMLSATSARKSG